MKWKDGGTRSDRWQSERFDDEDSAKVFKDAVDEAGQHWPPGWVKGRGYIDPTAANTLRYRFDRWALEPVENRTASKRYKVQCIRVLEMYMFPTFGNCDIRSAEHFSKATIAGSLLSSPGERRSQCLVQGSVHEVVADVRVDGQGAVALMADLLLDRRSTPSSVRCVT
ncbi:hypothetical protein SAMN02745898_1235 [Streptomyces sp. 136MFCol5.1]|uniref:hypothetical protein n=1 Tax=unclassified Streptomyces TaxID=2593676 RepID=UPI0008870928|nr:MULTISPECIES: hypothetical protein [unclassified Streptomyces]SCZ17150.1 hypothetical protein SAMN02745898_1235 [Streptomyces sp. 136MFCol5.1]SFS84739.1 hypothetical protein SAMN04487982_10410 [Streptomyces sp. ok210]